MSSPWSLANSQADLDASGSSGGYGDDSSGGRGGYGYADSWAQDELTAFDAPEPKTRDAVVFLLDCTAPMFTLNAEGQQHFRNAVSLIALFIRQKVIQSPDDLIGVLLFGTSLRQDNSHGFRGVHVYAPLSEPSAEMIRTVNALADDAIIRDIGVGEERDVNMKEALWICQAMFSTSKAPAGGARGGGGDGGGGGGGGRGGRQPSMARSNRRVMVWTTNDRPFTDATSLAQALDKARDLREQETELKLFRLHKADHKFNMAAFWRSALVFADDESSLADLERDERDGFAELREQIFQRVHKKRALGSIHFELGHAAGAALNIGVKLFCLYLEAKKEAPVMLNKQTNVKLSSETLQYSSVYAEPVQTGGSDSAVHVGFGSAEPVQRHQLRKYYPFGGAKAYITDDELRQLKTVGDAGLLLLGFKDIAHLHPMHNVRSAYFVYPDEAAVKGSVRAFYALLLGMAELKQFALARLVYRKGTVPRLVALLPQLEKVDDKGQLESSQGLHLVFLPYADDIRQLDIPVEQKPPDDLQQAARSIIRAVNVKRYDPAHISNPALQKHYAVIQAMALQEPTPTDDDLRDELQPDAPGMQKHAALFEAFNSLAFTGASDAEVGSKRRGGGGGHAEAQSKRVKKEAVSDAEYDAFPWEELKASGDGWKRLTVNDLKIYLRRHGLPLSGKKDDLILRIESHNPQ